MKKAVVLTFIFAFILSSACLLSASGSGYLPSVSVEDTIIVTIKEEDAREVIGYLTDEDGNVIETIYRECIVDTSVLEIRNGSDAISDEAKGLLLETYKEFLADNVKLSEKVPVLNEIVKNNLGDSSSANDLAVRDIYDFTVLSDKLNEYLETEGNTVTLTLKIPTESDKFIYAVVLVDGVWKPVVQVTNNYDGTINVTFSDFCPVMFVVGDKDPITPTPPTGDTSKPHILILIMFVSALCLIGCLVALTRFPSKNRHKRTSKTVTNNKKVDDSDGL